MSNITISSTPASTAPYADLRTASIRVNPGYSLYVTERTDGTYHLGIYAYEVRALVHQQTMTAASFEQAIGEAIVRVHDLLTSPELLQAVEDRAASNAQYADANVGDMLGDLMG